MRLVIVASYQALSHEAAEFMAEHVNQRPSLVLLAATGETPMGAYRALAGMAHAGQVDPSQISLVQLDEYEGVARDDRRSLFGWMKRALIDQLGISRVVAFDPDSGNLAAVCREHRRALRTRGIDLAVLGLGSNGHLGFNEPPSGPSAPTRVVDLSPASIASNSRYWGSRSTVPRRALTVGMDAILASRTILLLVSGPHKADILRRMLEGPVTPHVPASLLRRAGNVTIIADKQAWPWAPEDVRLSAEVELIHRPGPATAAHTDAGECFGGR